MSDKKYTICTISDHICASSGVGLQTRYIVDHLVKTGKFRVIAIGAAVKHDDYRLQKVKELGDDVVIVPCDSYGTPSLMRDIMRSQDKPDALWIMTDPRFYDWLFNMEHEVRSQMPILYNNIWDNYPVPKYNLPYYDSVDFLGCISKLTYDIVCQLGFSDKAKYIPHGVPENDFDIIYDKTQTELKIQFLGEEHKNSFVVFYNSRNAPRKKTGSLIMAFKEFRESLPVDERDSVVLLMHTPPLDPEGQNLFSIIKDFDLVGPVKFSDKKLPTQVMKELYNAADLTASLSSEEGFGLCVLESLMCGTPVLATRTGGMQDQLIDSEKDRVFGKAIEPTARIFLGSQTTPYIWSDIVDPSVAAKHLREFYDSWKEDKNGFKEKWAGHEARASMLRRFNLKDVQRTWEEEIVRCINDFQNKEKKLNVSEI